MKANNKIQRLGVFLLAVSAPLLTVADDTEIYLASQGSGDSRSEYEPNILFILDTSGSMKGGEIGLYDPDIDYIKELEDLGISHTCEKGKIYRTSDYSEKTDDGTSSGTFVTGHGVSCGSYWFNETSLNCPTGKEKLKKFGYYSDNIQEYTGSRWQNLTTNDPDRTVSCEVDDGRLLEDSTQQWVVDGTATGFDSSTTNHIDWNGTYGKSSARKPHILYSANYLAWRNDYSRIKVLNKVMHNTLDDLKVGNVGMMMFDYATGSGDSTKGGPVIHEVDHISTARTSLKNTLDTYITYTELDGRSSSSSSPTPLAETMWEGYLYYSGQDWDYGDESAPIHSVPASRVGSGSQYQTPIQKACQKNYIVYLTDGDPTADNDRDDEMNALFTAANLNDEDGSALHCSFNSDNTGDNCLDEMALYLHNVDLMPSMGTGTEDEDQTIITHVVGFGIDNQLMKDAARKGGGQYFNANSADQLTNAFRSILRDVTADSGSFTAPAVSVNAFNRLMHRNDLYFTLFKPSTNSRWDGNLKKYRLKKVSGSLVIVDADEEPAVNSLNGQFKEDSRSFWTPANTTDGEDVALGGAAANLELSIPHTGILRARTALATTSPNNSLYSSGANSIDETNTANINVTRLAFTGHTNGDTDHLKLLKWIRGVDVNDYDNDSNMTEMRLQIGDPLHTQPVVVTYGGTNANPDVTVFMTTNDGFLHAFDAETGNEQIAFVPEELLAKQKYGFDESLSTGKLYGLDGGITAWINDADADGAIESGEHVYLYVGMRRGGKNYYALDVTDRDYPSLKWRIRSTDTGYDYLGQTWSKPTLAKLKIGTTDTDVIIFGGGFDDGGPDSQSEDLSTPPATHDIGNAIYIVDASDGKLLYVASGYSSLTVPTGAHHEQFTGMDYAIPSDLAVLDINNNGYADRIYVGDLGGQLWRFDIKEGGSNASLVDGTILAKLGRTATGAASSDYRRFFNKPDVALIADETLGTFLSIGIGSGRRNEPTDVDIQDRFFSIWDTNVYSKPTTYPSAVDASDLYDATDNLVAEGTAQEQSDAQTTINTKKGWYIDLEHGDSGQGEKALSTSITLDNQLMFTTYEPPGSLDPDSCDAGTGSGHFYLVNVADATPVVDRNNDGEVKAGDRSTELARAGIPPSPVVLFPEANDGEATVLVGSEIQDVPLKNRTRRTYWYSAEN